MFFLDPGSGENGGDLDFAKPESYVPEFGQALVKLKKGEMTDTAVKTQFGWHIIRVDDIRQAELPKMEDIKPQIAQQMRAEGVQVIALVSDDIEKWL